MRKRKRSGDGGGSLSNRKELPRKKKAGSRGTGGEAKRRGEGMEVVRGEEVVTTSEDEAGEWRGRMEEGGLSAEGGKNLKDGLGFGKVLKDPGKVLKDRGSDKARSWKGSEGGLTGGRRPKKGLERIRDAITLTGRRRRA